MKEKKQSRKACKPARKSQATPRGGNETKKPTSAKAKVDAAGPRSPLQVWINQLLIRSIRERADAIHIESKREGLTVRLRVDGVLHDVLYPVTVAKEGLRDGVIPRLKVMSKMKLDAKRRPQDGLYSAMVDGRQIDFRTSSLPAPNGESLVIRVIDPGRSLAVT